MKKFLLHCVLWVRDIICSDFYPLINPFDQLSNENPNAISNVLILIRLVELLEALFVMSYLEILDRGDKFVMEVLSLMSNEFTSMNKIVGTTIINVKGMEIQVVKAMMCKQVLDLQRSQQYIEIVKDAVTM